MDRNACTCSGLPAKLRITLWLPLVYHKQTPIFIVACTVVREIGGTAVIAQEEPEVRGGV
jgi:hypothetical protein